MLAASDAEAGPLCSGFWDCLPLELLMLRVLATPFALAAAIACVVALFRSRTSARSAAGRAIWIVLVGSLLLFASGFAVRFESLRGAFDSLVPVSPLHFNPHRGPTPTDVIRRLISF